MYRMCVTCAVLSVHAVRQVYIRLRGYRSVSPSVKVLSKWIVLNGKSPLDR